MGSSPNGTVRQDRELGGRNGLSLGVHLGPPEPPDQTASLEEQPAWRSRVQTAASRLDSSHSLSNPELLPNRSVPQFPYL